MMDLGARIRPVGGCVDGLGPGSYVCKEGGSGETTPDDCLSGAIASSDAACLTGGNAGYECGSGSGPDYPGNCEVGPSVGY